MKPGGDWRWRPVLAGAATALLATALLVEGAAARDARSKARSLAAGPCEETCDRKASDCVDACEVRFKDAKPRVECKLGCATERQKCEAACAPKAD